MKTAGLVIGLLPALATAQAPVIEISGANFRPLPIAVPAPQSDDASRSEAVTTFDAAFMFDLSAAGIFQLLDRKSFLTDPREGMSANTIRFKTGLTGTIRVGYPLYISQPVAINGPGARIIAVDQDRWALGKNREVVAARFPEAALDTVVGDLTGSLDLPMLDGLVAANSLHFVTRDRQLDVVRRLAGRVRPGGTFLLVEYDADREWRTYLMRQAGVTLVAEGDGRAWFLLPKPARPPTRSWAPSSAAGSTPGCSPPPPRGTSSPSK